MMCSACAERDVSFGCEVRFAHEKRNTSCAAIRIQFEAKRRNSISRRRRRHHGSPLLSAGAREVFVVITGGI